MDPVTVSLYVGLIGGLLAILYAIALSFRIMKYPTGSKEMVAVSDAVREGAVSFMKRQYGTIGIVALIITVLFVGVAYLGKVPVFYYIAVAFAVGALFSAIAGIVGMSIAVRANVRTTEGARRGLAHALKVAFQGGSVSGFAVVGLSLFGVSGFYWLYTDYTTLTPLQVLESLVGFGFGASLVSLFARVGGGIYTKAADVGADLVGKVEAGIPEDDPRNPAVIADNVGDNVGDCAGMGADLFETYAVTAIAAMLLGFLMFQDQPWLGDDGVSPFIVFPLLLGGIAIAASIIGSFFVRLGGRKDIMGALYKGVIVTGILSLIGAWFAIEYLFADIMGGASGLTMRSLFGPVVVGVAVMAGMMIITEYYTSTKYPPVQKIARASETGAATNIISGLAVGMFSTLIPVLIISTGILAAYNLMGGGTIGLYGVAIAAVAMLSTTGMIVALDSYGPITDNAGGIAEMTNLPPEVRETTDALDAVGNTTKAVTKGYAIGSAALAALALFADFVHRIEAESGGAADISFRLSDPLILVGLFIGGMLPFLFSAFLMEAVGKAAYAVINEVRRQFREIPGIMERKTKPEYGTCVDIVTRSALKEMAVPSLMAVIVPLLVGFILGPIALGGLLIGVIISGLLLAISMANGGGAWDNAKKYIEDGHFGGKGSEAHKAAVVGDTVGDPYKDTAGPAINALIKVINTVSLIFAGLFVTYGLALV
ncbi:MAG: sodium-translocating pyrophosphatase [Euryarchaeota archaeon]|nr:sodium-translocating pyrophosphatase [Euryarchaeota archaeon]